MKTTASIVVRTATTLLSALLLAGCSDDGAPTGANIAEPANLDKVYNKDLLTKQDDDVLVASKTAADENGLKISTTSEGEGDDVLDYGEVAKFHIDGRDANGKRFLNTRAFGGSPTEVFVVEGGEIEGLILGCIGMKKGEIRSLLVPPSLAYGEAGDPVNGVGPSATLIYHIELVEFGEAVDKKFLMRRSKKGEGEALRVGQTGFFHYTGILAEGENAGLQFDSSRLRGEPLSVRMDMNGGGVIKGWGMGLIGIKLGETRWLKIPAKMAYANRSRGDIPAGSTLIFEIERVAPPGPGGPGGFGGPPVRR